MTAQYLLLIYAYYLVSYSSIFIGVARIFSGVNFFPQKSWRLPFLVVVALRTQAKTTKWTTPTLQLQISTAKQKMS